MSSIEINLQLPNEISEKANKILLFDSLNLFGEECGNFFNESMLEIDKDWFIKLKQQRNNFSLHLFDPDFVIKEPLIEDSPLQKILPSSKSLFQNLKILKKLRNYVSHAKFDGEISQTVAAIQVLFDVSMQFNLLNCQNNFAEAIQRLYALQNGKVFAEGINLEERTLELELKSAELEEQLISERNKSKDLESQYEDIVSDNAEKRAEIEELKLIANSSKDDLAKLEKELNLSRVLASELEKQVFEQKSATEEVEKNSKELSLFVNKLVEVIKESTKSNEINSSSINISQPKIGEIWVYEKGKRKLTLSIASRDLLDSKSGRAVDDIPEIKRKELAELWLGIRPSGGRIFVDGEGNACTLVGEVQIYLGNIN